MFPLRIRNVSDKSYRDNQNKNFFQKRLFWKSCPILNNVEKYCRAGQDKDGNMANALSSRKSRATNTHSKYVKRIDFPLQQ